MKAINATFTNGRIVLNEPPDWPDGIRVVIRLVATGDQGSGTDKPDEEGVLDVMPTVIVVSRKEC